MTQDVQYSINYLFFQSNSNYLLRKNDDHVTGILSHARLVTVL